MGNISKDFTQKIMSIMKMGKKGNPIDEKKQVVENKLRSTKAKIKMITLNDPVAKARERGYTGDICPECQSMTMVRNGTCLKCTTCGATTGCS